MAVNSISSSTANALTQQYPQQQVKGSGSDGDKDNSSIVASKQQQATTNSIGQTIGTMINTTA